MAAYELTGTIETERLRLRPFAERDFEALHEMRSDEGVARFLYWEPETPDETRGALARKLTQVALRGEGDVLALAAEHRETGALVADVILHWVSVRHGAGEVGYVVHPAHTGLGYATEATAPLLAVAFDSLDLHRVVGRTEARNAASARVLEKLGLRREAHFVENEWVKGEWQSELVYAVLADEWRARR